MTIIEDHDAEPKLEGAEQSLRVAEVLRRPDATVEIQRDVARFYDVPPWLISGDIKAPRFPRQRWALRRWWPL